MPNTRPSSDTSSPLGRRGLLMAGGGVLAWSLAPAAHAASFRDVPSTHLFAKETSWLADRGITTGWPDGTFRPDAPVHRDAMAAFVYRLQGSPAFTPPTTSPFRDVPVSSQFYREISWCVANGILRGWPDGTFRPLADIARDAAVVMFHRLAGSPSVADAVPFRDVPTTHPFAAALGWARTIGLMTGYQDGTYRPLQSIERGAVAALFYRYVNGGVFGKGVTVRGAIARTYWAGGAMWGSYGLPTGNATTVPSGRSGKRGAQQAFAGGAVVIAGPDGGAAHASTGGLCTEWRSAGLVPGSLGFPTGPVRTYGAGWRQDFEGGYRTYYSGWNPPESLHGPVTAIAPVAGGVPLRRGWNGTRVRIIHKKLGISRTGSAQTYDATTESAVIAFQKRNGLTADGVVGAATWAKLAPEYPFTMDAWTTPVRVAKNASRTTRIEEMIRFAQSCKGSPYTWGGAGWKDDSVAGYDCSGLLLQALYSAGLELPPITVVRHAEPTYRTSQMMYADTKLKSVPLVERQRGDFIFYGDSNGIVRHVTLYLGNGRMIQAANPDTHELAYSGSLWGTRFVKPTVKRPFA
ncbi:S-layer homology domain-containing protein [Brachybacterium sp. EF45031]|uniref:S-layer homology domain-containing protein n=1 Tax=Brachybacterium sillae TaxID=2810536 RepID=UPI00217D8D2B|nr:S-layer homology domain-containing protein [Brachybacterium sillae]MCS6711213.1 S-layer homology domain-containing protein [Brachybacterium sillae]